MNDVSRETPLVPEAARGVFHERLDLAEQFAEFLADAGTVRGLIGPREVPRLWERHLLNCAVVGEALPEAVSVCDVGSGAGLPGLVLAIARPDLRVTLLEPLLRRTTFLDEAVESLELDNVRVVRGRAEQARELFGTFDVVTSRAVAPLDRLARWSVPLIRPGGEMLAMKGSSAEEEIREHLPALRKLGCVGVEVITCGEGVVDPPVRLIRAEKRPESTS